MEDCELLREYTERQSEAAFTELVSRHVNLVYSTAFRVVGESQLAQDVAQSVFIQLARKARSIREGNALPGWLYRATCSTAANSLRGEHRRRQRETEAMNQAELQSNPQDAWETVAPLLEEAMQQLNQTEQDAILLRFFEGNTLRQAGATLGLTEDAMQKRVSRAVERLREFFAKRGVALSTTVLGTALAAKAVTAAPAGLAATLAGAALASAATGGTVGATALQFMTLTKLKLGIVTGLAAAGIAAPWAIQHHSQARLRAENQSLRRQLDQFAQVAAENEQLSNMVARANDSQTASKGQMNELLRLRGEVGRLRQESKETERLRQENARLRAASPRVLPQTGAEAQASNSPSPSLHIRTYKVSVDSMLQQMRSSTVATQGTPNLQIVQQVFRDNGVEMEPTSTLFLNEETGMLVARTSMTNHEAIERVLQKFP